MNKVNRVTSNLQTPLNQSINTMIMIMIIIYVYQLGTGGRTQEAKPVQGVYP